MSSLISHRILTCVRVVTFSSVLLFVVTGSFGSELSKPDSSIDVVCSYAPSQSKAVIAVSGVAGGAAATTAGIGSALGLTVVTHSSGALILSGAGGYIAGTLGAAIVAPAVLVVGAVVGGTAVTIELLCAPKNNPDGYKRVVDAASEFGRRTGNWVQDAKEGLKSASTQAATFGAIKMTSITGSAMALYQRVFKQ